MKGECHPWSDNVMIVLRDAIHVNASPEDVFEWLRNLDKNYRSWHRDHVKWDYQDGFWEGGAVYCEELIHGKPHRMKGMITRLEENRLVEFRFNFPTSLICPGGSFIIEPSDGGVRFIATLSFRFGRFFSRFAKRRVNALKDHMKEEGQNLKRLLEGAGFDADLTFQS